MSLRHAILGFLALRPMSGYDLKRAFDTSVRHFWSADQAAIYRALAELETARLVEHERITQTARPDRKLYQATKAGRAALDAWLRERTPPVPRREPLLVKLFFAGPLGAGTIRQMLDAERVQVDEELGAFAAYVHVMRERVAAAGEDERTMLLGPLLTLTNGVRLGVAYRDWLASLSAMALRGTLTSEVLLEDLQQTLGVARGDSE